MRKNIKTLTVFVIMAVGMSLCSPVCLYAYEQKSAYSFRKLIIRQETYSINGVTVCQPSSLDIEIRHLINQNNIRSIEDYTNWLKENIRYAKDEGKDTWAVPQITLGKKYGDCEDFAFLNVAVLRVLGYQSRVLVMKGPTGCHAVCVFKENGYYFWFDNAELKKTSIQTIAGFSQYLHKEYGCNRLLALNPEVKKYTSVANPSFEF